MKKTLTLFLLLFSLLLPTFAQAQSNRNPCAYLGTNLVSALPGNCLAIGYYLAGATGVPMPVGGIANAAAPTFTEAKPGYLSFDLSGNLRTVATVTPSGTQNVNLTQILSAAPSLTNPLWVFPATGATFPVSGTVTTTGPSTGGGFPNAATPITISATGTTAATVATLATTSGKTTYICGFSITSDATAGLAGNATVAGVITGTMTYIQGVGVAPAVASLTQNYSPCVPASTTNTTIVITSAAAGVGGGTAVNAWGYQQ